MPRSAVEAISHLSQVTLTGGNRSPMLHMKLCRDRAQGTGCGIGIGEVGIADSPPRGLA